ncbi:hypothetical protein MAR_024865 [Mya arenaria]|uniref:Uncharacterized protein n=1 Tax=Mya arenaria TaxID=6604 RepID=A0ABY7DS12_MYAAR|nr:hypothetical protein MAR_024865 [Mya arenaria]
MADIPIVSGVLIRLLPVVMYEELVVFLCPLVSTHDFCQGVHCKLVELIGRHRLITKHPLQPHLHLFFIQPPEKLSIPFYELNTGVVMERCIRPSALGAVQVPKVVLTPQDQQLLLPGNNNNQGVKPRNNSNQGVKPGSNINQGVEAWYQSCGNNSNKDGGLETTETKRK